VSYTGNALNQYTAVGAVAPTCDGNGNLTSDGTFTFGYDAENRLISASGAGSTASYTFDAQGRRKTRTVNGTTTVFVTDAANREVLEYDGASGAIQRWYAYGLGPNEVLGQMNVPAGTRATLVPDMLGSVIGTLDSTSGVLSKVGYLPYGKSPSGGPFGYTGQRLDAEISGLYYYRARHYSHGWGRFLQPDPIGYAGGSNPYAYVGNDPLNLVDPNGLAADFIGKSYATFGEGSAQEQQATANYFNEHPYVFAAVVASPFAAVGVGAVTESLFIGGSTSAVAAEAVATANLAQAGGAARGVAAALEVGGKTITDISSGAARQIGQVPTQVNPAIQSVINRLPTNSPFAGSCAEIGCLSQALNSGINPAGGSIGTAAIRATGNAAHGTPVAPCVTCSQVLRYFGVKY